MKDLIGIAQFRLCTMVVAALTLSACLTDGTAYQGEDIAELREEFQTKIDEASLVEAKELVRVIEGPYVELNAIEQLKGSEVLRNQISIFSREIPVRLLLQEVLVGTPYTETADFQAADLAQPVSINFTGELGDFLDRMMRIVGGGYSVTDGVVRFHYTTTRIFQVSIPSGDLSWSMSSGGSSVGGISGGSGGGTSSGQGGGGAGGGQGGGSGGDSGSISVSAALSIWTELEQGIAQIVGDEPFTFSASPGSGVLAVTAPEFKLDEIQQYIDGINHELTQRIEVKLHIIAFNSSNEKNYGIDWSLFTETAGFNQENECTQAVDASGARTGAVTCTGVQGNYRGGTFLTRQLVPSQTDDSAGTSTDSSASTGTDEQDYSYPNQFGTTPNALVLSERRINADGSEDSLALFLQALENQGEVLNVTSPRAVTLNNQPVSISNVSQVAYAASTTAGVSTGSGNADAGIEPGVYSVGTQFLIVPKIVGGDVVLHIQSTTSTASLRTFDSGTTVLQYPQVTTQSNNLRVKVRDGSAVAVGGLNSVSANNSDSSSLWFTNSGSKVHRQAQTVLLIEVNKIEG